MKLHRTPVPRAGALSLSRRTFCLSALSTIGLAAGAAGCKTSLRPPNLILIVLDTVRADHLSCWGYKRQTSPHIDSFACESTVYRQARATSPWTLPSHTTLFTGQYSFQHGVEARSETNPDGQMDIVEPAVPDSATMLAETLRAAGYATAAFTANTPYMGVRWNLTQGFDSYEVERLPGVAMIKPIETWLRGHKNPPFFLFVNFMDAHFPYNTKPCPGALDEPVPQDNSLAKKLMEAVLPGEKPADDSLVRDVTAQYDMGIANADYAVGQLMATLRQFDLYDGSLVIVTSDHGEFLGEHLLAQHSKDLYEQVLHVPLLVKLPRQRIGQWNDGPVSLVQLYGTIQRVLRAQDLPAAPHLDEPQPLLAELNYSRPWDITHPIWGRRFRRLRTAYYELTWKFIHSSDGRHELYNLREDPSETKNRVHELPDLAHNLLARLEAIKPLSAKPNLTNQPPPELTEQDREALRASGYL